MSQAGPGLNRPTINDALFAGAAKLLAPLRAAPWWVQVSLIYAAARLVSFAILAAAAWHAEASPWGPRQPDYLTFINRWDAGWYERIFNGGYPSAIPRDSSGLAEPNQWAFYPLFPLLVKGLSLLTGLGWEVAAPLVATVAGFAAALVIYRLFREFASPGTALWGVAFFATFPISPILQIPYAESLNTLLLAAALLLLVRRHYVALIPLVVLLCLSRPVGVPFAALVGVHLVLRWWRRGQDLFPVGERISGAVLLLISAVMAVSWMVIAWWATGERSAYTDTETSWRGESLVPFKPWFQAGVDLVGPLWGPVLPLLLIALAALYLNSRAVRRIGIELRIWCGMYLLYLMAVLHPQSSTFRMLLPLFPLALAAAFISPSRAFRWTVLLMNVLLQLVWVVWLWQFVAIGSEGGWPP